MDPEKKKDFVKTGLITVVFVAIALILLNMLIGDPGAIPEPPRP